MNESQLETRIALQATKDAAKEGIPLVADVEQNRFTTPSIVIRHYDHGKDLSLSELRLIQAIVKVAAGKHLAEAHYTLETLRFSATLKTKAP